MESIINMWKCRNLSLKGKICIIKTLILPQIQFLFSTLYIPHDYLNKIDKILFNFLWNGKISKIKRNSIISNINEGGLNMVDVFTVHTTAKCMWIKRLLNTDNCKFKSIMFYMLGFPQHMFNKNPDKSILKHSKTAYHSQIIEAWISLNTNNPSDIHSILNQFILYNQHIKINNQILNSKFLNNQVDIKIKDIINTDGTFKEYETIKQTTISTLTLMKYNTLVSSIPNKWKVIIKNNNNFQYTIWIPI